MLRSRAEPEPGNFDATDREIECYFGDTVRVRYIDSAASTESGELELLEEVPVVIGTDGLVAAFSKTFNDEELAVETKFHIAESYFELFKSHRDLGRNDEEKADLAAGRRILREVMEDYPDPKYVPRIAYLFGQFAQELESWTEATESYAMIVRQFPEHPLAADAQYKLAQSYEEAGDFDEALEAYVTLAATYPKSPLIASVMIRISDHFYKAEEFDVAAQVGEKFLDRFEGHQHAARIAFRVGQCAYKGEKFKDAGEAFDRFNKLFPDDELAADALFWSGESFRKGNDNREAFRRYNRCRWDFPGKRSCESILAWSPGIAGDAAAIRSRSAIGGRPVSNAKAGWANGSLISRSHWCATGSASAKSRKNLCGRITGRASGTLFQQAAKYAACETLLTIR